MSPTTLERLAFYFGGVQSRQGLLGREALGAPEPSDPELALRLVEQMAAELRPDGSVGGAIVPTIWRAHELMDLGRTTDDPALARVMGWILERQGAPGAYAEGCDKGRHSRRLCEHYLGGFFSPGPASERIAPVSLPNGKVFRAEPAARFAVSCFALRAVLRAGLRGRPRVIRHLESLRLMATGWMDWTGYFPPDVIVAGMHALALGGPAYHATVERLIDAAAGRQRVDGQWTNADFFQIVEALTATGLPTARIVVRRAVSALEEKQRDDGSFGTSAQQERALIGLRAVLWATSG